jgi:hypothetical protein
MRLVRAEAATYGDSLVAKPPLARCQQVPSDTETFS